MKRAVFVLITLMLMLSFAGNVLAEEVTADVSDLFTDWETNGYPDDVGGVYYDEATGGMVITLVNADEARKAEIRSMVKDPTGLSFGESKYSYNEMLAVLKEIQNEMSDISKKIYGAGVGWANIDGKTTGFGESGKEFRIVVSVDNSVYDKYVKAYKAQYGDMVYVEPSDGFVPLRDDGIESSNAWLLPTVAAMCVLMAFATLYLKRRGLGTAMQTTSNITVTTVHPLSKQEVVQAVKESAVSPSETVHEKLMQKIEEQN